MLTEPTIIVDSAPQVSALDAAIEQCWQHHRSLEQTLRGNRKLIRQARYQLGLLLCQKHAELAAAGCEGQFTDWLMDHHIPRATAYRVMGKASTTRNRLTETILSPYILKGDRLTLQLNPRQLALFKAALPIAEDRNTGFDLPAAFIYFLLGRIPASERNRLNAAIPDC